MMQAIKICVCKHCGVSYRPKASNRDQYCSRDCFYDLVKKEKAERVRKKNNLKAINQCKLLLQRAVKQIERKQAMVKHRTCVVCEQPFTQTRVMGVPSVVCGDKCREVKANQTKQAYKTTDKYKTVRYTEKVKRRLKNKQIIEQINPLEVMEAQGYICACCGYEAPKHLRGTNEWNAPEIDHIIPLAMGGLHTRENTQMLCRKCNHNKGNTIG